VIVDPEGQALLVDLEEVRLTGFVAFEEAVGMVVLE
jgi:hypothetical protein